MEGKVLIISAPSGAGKSTLINHLLERFTNLEFSISATSRSPRGSEVDGKDYYFISNDEFKKKVERGEFLEWEEVYNGTCYGTLNSELKRIWSSGNVAIFDIDVVGGTNVKGLLPHNSLSIFINPPSIDILRERLQGRATDKPEEIQKRVDKAVIELGYKDRFDEVILNDNLEEAKSKIESIVNSYING